MLLRAKSIIAQAAIGLLLAGGSAVRAGVIDIPESADAGLFAGGGANNSLATPGIYVGVDAKGNVKRGLIEFNVASSLPAGSIITGVTLQMAVGIVAGSEGSPVIDDGPVQTISLYNENQQWGAPSNVPGAAYFDSYGNGIAAQTGDATWNNAATPGTAWNVAPGGNWTSSSVDLADAQVPGTKGYIVTWSSAALAAEVQNWLDNPSSNDGLLVKDQDETTLTTFRGFYSEQGAENYGDMTLAPELEVTYTSPVPEPATLSLLVVGLPVVLRRRRSA